MSDVIGRLLDDRAVVARVARAATRGRQVGSRVGAVEVDPIPATSMATGAVARVRGNLTFDHVVAIDWQLSGWCAVGFDVGQLIAGHAQSGDLDPAQLDAAYTAAIEEYTGVV